ncbi:MAG: glycosyltransferase family 4 protein [Anaerolineae bacterium]|nr:glycosyltransferase family 4 protein [Anaerolineae bacterium]
MNVQLVTRNYQQMIGLARYTTCLCRALEQADITYTLRRPTHGLLVRLAHRLLSPFGFDVRTFFTTYPLSAGLKRGTLTHLTTQQMAIMLWLHPHVRPVVVTVHDIVPFLVRDDVEQSTFQHPIDRWFDQWAMAGLKCSDALISDSQFTKQAVVATLGYPEGKVHVVHLGVVHSIFHPRAVPQAFYQRFQLDPSLRYILYVGSENPRKNLSRLLRAFAAVHAQRPDLRLIKIGSIQYGPQAEALRRQISELDLGNDVLLIDHVTDQDLALFYNAATLFAFPSLYEGFGLPPLEAMACGTPVVCSSAASLPEVVGDAAIAIDPTDVDALAASIVRVLGDSDLRDDLRQRGLARAARFTWERTARATVEVYEKVLGKT